MISPTLACVDYLIIGESVREMDLAGVDFYHVDIMDGHYVPNLSLNFDMMSQIRSVSKTPMDVHLMVKNPLAYVNRLMDAKVEYACCHLDACPNPVAFLKEMREKKIKVGLALAPEEPVESLLPFLELLDYVLVMFVQPGFSGQQFNPDILEKIRVLDRIRKRKQLSFLIEGDGGIGWDNVGDVVDAGTDIVVAGVFAVFGQPQGLYQACVDFKEKAISFESGGRKN